jgi:serine/threonine-protein kinase
VAASSRLAGYLRQFSARGTLVHAMTDPILAALSDRYRVDRELGRGGMATVYFAEDLRHHRRVAIKVLRPDLGTSLGSERFLKEIELTAGLQHPHLVPLFDSGSADGMLFFVMPYIEGESLRARLEREKQLPLDDVVGIATEAADALDYAHRHGVVHRDIKPENILLHDGHALVADFGISIALEQAGAERLTATGVSVGTPQYMSPEQLSADRTVDARTDIFSLGAVTYEMLTGIAPHTGPTAAATAARVLVDVPTPLGVLRPGLPPNVERAVTRALSKAPADRFATASDFSSALRGTGGHDVRPRERSRSLRRATIALGVAVLVVAGTALLVSRSRAGAARLGVGRVTHLTRDPGLELDPALSPDGKSIAYAAGPAGDMRIYVRQISGGRAIRVAESLVDNQRWPQWSPDGTTLVFQVGHSEREADSTMPPNALYVVPALGGIPRRLFADTASDLSPSWSPDGARIAFARGEGVYGRSIYVVDAAGTSPPRQIATANQPSAPRWSPDGTLLAFVSDNPRFALGTAHLGNNALSSIWIVTVADGRAHRVTSGAWLDVSPVWSPDGSALFFVSSRNGSRDVFRVAIAGGDPQGAPEQITSGLNAHGIDLSRDGKTLAYSVFNPYAHVWSVAIPPSGSATLANATQVTTGDETDEGFALSPDGRWLAYDSDRSGNGDVWTIPSAGGEPAQLTTDLHGDFVQDWSFDGAEIAFHSFRTGHRQVFVMNADGSNVRRVTNLPNDAANPDFSPDANTIAFDYSYGVSAQVFLVSRPRRGEPFGAPRQLTRNGGTDPQWSPDGKSVAYVKDGIRVISPDGSNDRLVIPRTTGANGLDPVFAYWAPDGRSLYYKAYDARERSSIWIAPIERGAPRLLIRFDDPARPSGRREIATDGKRMFFSLAQQEADVWLMELISK